MAYRRFDGRITHAIIEQEFKKTMAELGEAVEKLTEQAKVLASKPTVTKADRQVFLNTAHTIKCKIDSCTPFIHQQFNESMDDVLTDAKADLQGFVGQLVRTLGLEGMQAKLQEMQPDLKALKPAIDVPEEKR